MLKCPMCQNSQNVHSYSISVYSPLSNMAQTATCALRWVRYWHLFRHPYWYRALSAGNFWIMNSLSMGMVAAPVFNDSSINASRDIPLASNSSLFIVFLEEKIVLGEDRDCCNVGQDQAQMGACCIHFLRGCDNQFVVVLHANCQGL